MTEDREAWKRRTFHEHYGFAAPPPAETVYDLGQSEETESPFSSVEEWVSYVLERAREEGYERPFS